jgi:hypothetical protein
MDRKKLMAGLAAFLSGAALSVGSAQAQLTGYLQGDPAPSKMIPYYQITSSLSTIIGLENTAGQSGPGVGNDILVHARIYTTKSVEQTNFFLCLSPFDFGFVVLQNAVITAGQQAELTGALARFSKARVYSVLGDGIAAEGYVSFVTVASYASTNGSCTGGDGDVDTSDGSGEPLAAWAILQDIGSGFFATEIPALTVNVNESTGVVLGGFGAFGLIPVDNTVIARYDVNPTVDSKTSIYVWLASTSTSRNAWPANIDCEDELPISTTIPLPNEVNVINPDALVGMAQCKNVAQYRGVLLFDMPDTGFIWSQISQAGQNYRMNFLGYNLNSNEFLVD